MAAVYILLGCLALSALVILGMLCYCVLQCWRQRNVSAGAYVGGTPLPVIKISQASSASAHCTDAYSTLNPSEAERASMEPDARPAAGRPLRRRETMERVYRRFETKCMAGFERVVGMNGQPPWMERAADAAKQEDGSAKERLLSDDGCEPSAGLNGGGVPIVEVEQTEATSCPPSRRSSVASQRPEDRPSIIRFELGYEKTPSSCVRGSFTFALRYDFIHRVLMVHAIRAAELVPKSASCDPYAKMYLLPERRHHCKTKIYRRTLKPDFNEMFSFDVPFNSLATRMLQITVFDFDRFTRHDLIGNVIMRDLFERSDLYTWTEYTMQIVGSNEKDDFGDLLIYLSHSAVDGKMIATVAKAYNLRPMDITGASDPYVKIEQIYQNRRVKVRKTTIKRANLNPVYHETLDFDIPEDQIGKTNLLIQVMDWDRIGRDDLLGCCVMGPDAPNFEGRDHWRECFALPLVNQHALAAPLDGASLSPKLSVVVPKPRAVGRWHSLLADVPANFRSVAKK